MSIRDWSVTANDNTSIDGIDIGEQCDPANINNAMRAIMAAVKDAQFDTISASVVFADLIGAATVSASSLFAPVGVVAALSSATVSASTIAAPLALLTALSSATVSASTVAAPVVRAATVSASAVYAVEFFGDGSNLTGVGGGLELLATASPAGAASVLFTSIPSSTYHTLLLVWRDLQPQTDNQVLLLEAAASSTPVTSGYQAGVNSSNYNSATLSNVQTTAAFVLCQQTGNAASESCSGHAWIQNLGDTLYTLLHGDCTSIDNGGAVDFGKTGGALLNTTAYTELNIRFNSGNIDDGEVRLYGLLDA